VTIPTGRITQDEKGPIRGDLEVFEGVVGEGVLENLDPAME
jgi:hypothetical protein